MLDIALPVAVDLADADLAADVTAHVESQLGWQVVRPGPHLPVRLLLADRVQPGIPTVVVLRGNDTDALRKALHSGALDVIVWPGDAPRLPGLKPTVRPQRPAGTLVAVAATAAGVGASTVVLALGGLSAWDGRTTAVVTGAAGRRLAGASPDGTQPIRGVPGLSVAAEVHAAAVADRQQVLLADVGVGRRCQVLVGRADRALADALTARPDIAIVVTVGQGSLRPGELRAVVDDRIHVALPWSYRVGRAGLLGRVPVGLPGAWVAALRPVLAVDTPAVAA